MSKSQSKKRPNSSKTQPSQSTSSQLSQLTLEASFSKSQKPVENLDELVNKCVRYFLYRAGSNLPIRKAELQKLVLKNVGRGFNTVMEKAKTILKDVYGYYVYECEDSQTAVRYLVSTTLPYKNAITDTNTESQSEEEPQNIPHDVHKVLIMLVLTHIFMSNNNATETSLFNFLRSLNIDSDNHDLFGNVKKFVGESMVNQKYLQLETDEITKRRSYLWGPRAEHEVSKHELLKFVCKMYKDRQPKSWASQFENANKQFEEPTNMETRDQVDGS